MSVSYETETSDSSERARKEHLGEYVAQYVLPEDFLRGESLSLPEEDIHPRWRKTPRTAADFSDSKSSVSSCHDSDYEAWLKEYYLRLFTEETAQAYFEKEAYTSDLVEEKPENVLTSLFPPIEKDIWSYSTKYWGPKDVRRHWPIRMNRNTYWFLPSIHPHLNLRSRYGRYHSLLNSAAAIPEDAYKRHLGGILKNTIIGLRNTNPQLLKIMFCDTLCCLKSLDVLSKKTIMRSFCRFLRKQENMEQVYLENLGLEKLDGIVLLCALCTNAGDVIKELHIWKMFGHGHSPPLIRELNKKGEFMHQLKGDKFLSKIHYFQILNKFSNLTHLSINYSYLANRKGDAILTLMSVRLGYLQKLRLLCIKDERPRLTNPGFGVGGWKIGDGVWVRVTELCPGLRVSFVFLNMPQYENVIVFLSKSIPVSDVYLSSGIDFTFDVPWDIDSTLLELRNWYAPTLENLSLHLWHHRDLLDFVIKCKVLEEFPNLVNFEFIGVLEDVETMEDFCCQLSKGTYKLKTLLFWVEEKYTNEKKLNLTRKRVSEIRSKYKKKFSVMDIDADLQTYSL